MSTMTKFITEGKSYTDPSLSHSRRLHTLARNLPMLQTSIDNYKTALNTLSMLLEKYNSNIIICRQRIIAAGFVPPQGDEDTGEEEYPEELWEMLEELDHNVRRRARAQEQSTRYEKEWKDRRWRLGGVQEEIERLKREVEGFGEEESREEERRVGAEEEERNLMLQRMAEGEAPNRVLQG